MCINSSNGLTGFVTTHVIYLFMRTYKMRTLRVRDISTVAFTIAIISSLSRSLLSLISHHSLFTYHALYTNHFDFYTLCFIILYGILFQNN